MNIVRSICGVLPGVDNMNEADTKLHGVIQRRDRIVPYTGENMSAENDIY